MSNKIKKDVIGMKFGKLTVLDNYIKVNGRKIKWLCQCDCGSEPIYVYRNCLIRGSTKSCGCIKRTIDGKSNSRLYKTWWGIKERCYNKNHISFKNYGEKGIMMCGEWLNDFNEFNNWAIKNGYNDSLTIERKDSDGNYEPSNCEWITKSENTARANSHTQKRRTKYLYYGISPNGEYHTFDNANQFAKIYNLKGALIRGMANEIKYKKSLYKGWKFGFTNIENKG